MFSWVPNGGNNLTEKRAVNCIPISNKVHTGKAEPAAGRSTGSADSRSCRTTVKTGRLRRSSIRCYWRSTRRRKWRRSPERRYRRSKRAERRPNRAVSTCCSGCWNRDGHRSHRWSTTHRPLWSSTTSRRPPPKRPSFSNGMIQDKTWSKQRYLSLKQSIRSSLFAKAVVSVPNSGPVRCLRILVGSLKVKCAFSV